MRLVAKAIGVPIRKEEGMKSKIEVTMTDGEVYVAIDALKEHLVDIKRAFGEGSLQVANAESLLEKLTFAAALAK